MGVVYSTNPDFKYEQESVTEDETLAPEKQKLTVSIDRRCRAGKQVTLVSGFVGSESDLKELGKTLKVKCGVGGTAKDGEITIQEISGTRSPRCFAPWDIAPSAETDKCRLYHQK